MGSVGDVINRQLTKFFNNTLISGYAAAEDIVIHLADKVEYDKATGKNETTPNNQTVSVFVRSYSTREIAANDLLVMGDLLVMLQVDDNITEHTIDSQVEMTYRRRRYRFFDITPKVIDGSVKIINCVCRKI